MILALILAAATPQHDIHILSESKDPSDPRVFVVDTRSIKATADNRRQMETWEGFRVKGVPFVTYMRLDVDCTHRVVRDATSFTIAPDNSTYASGKNMSKDEAPVQGSVGELAMEVACGEASVEPKASKGDQDPVAFTQKWLEDGSY